MTVLKVSLPVWRKLSCLGIVAVCTALSCFCAESDDPLIDFHSIIEITFAKNLQIAAARFEIEASDYQFRRFERNLSQFVPLIVKSTAGRDSESFLENGTRLRENEDEGVVSAGFEKEFFDGKQIAAAAGMVGSSGGRGDNSHPFIGGEILFPFMEASTSIRTSKPSFKKPVDL